MPTRTLSTLVAVFRNNAEAKAAADDLRSGGFTAGDIFITAGNGSQLTGAGSGIGEHEYHQHEGGIKGWFHSLFGENQERTPESDTVATTYEHAVNTGNVILSVDTNESNFETAAEILNRHTPIDIHRDSSDGAATTGSRQGVTAAAERNVASRGADEGAIPVVQEELKVGKRAILRGGVRVYSRLIEQPVQETIGLREEHVTVSRTPVNREVTDADLRRGSEQVVEVKEYAEEPVVSKTARVVEEVSVRKQASERNETIRDTVRHTDVRVENLGEGASRSTGTPAGGYDAAAYEDVNSSGQFNYDDDFRRDYTQNYANTGETYDTYAPAYQYGYTAANDPRYRGRNFDEVESELRSDYGQRYPNSTWERMKNSVRYGWDRLTTPNR